MSIEAITNYRRVSERIASSGQPAEHQFKSIAAAGYQVIINLAMPDSDAAIPEEGNLVTAAHLIYVHIPVPFDAPTLAHLETFLKLMTAFETARIWVHCVVNYRASAFLYQHARWNLGTPDDEARRIMLPSWRPDATWLHFLQLSRGSVP